MIYKIRMYGKVRKEKSGKKEAVERAVWEGGEVVLAMAYDIAISGYNTFNTNNLRLWRSRPYDEYEASMYPDEISYINSVSKMQEAEYITSIFYPNDKVQGGKELRLKQQYFYSAATLQDIIRRFNKYESHKFT
mmetsp:Transcript_43400/g.31699  ORF Transcript_43400/g.31699 Transcript_43400/m.31699 type:complete len:134 (-) Transcript_43400:1726-2127(-)